MATTQWDTRTVKCGPFRNSAGNLPLPHLYPTCVCKRKDHPKNAVHNYIMKTMAKTGGSGNVRVCMYIILSLCAGSLPILTGILQLPFR